LALPAILKKLLIGKCWLRPHHLLGSASGEQQDSNPNCAAHTASPLG
jgi:hypothetical protein